MRYYAFELENKKGVTQRQLGAESRRFHAAWDALSSGHQLSIAVRGLTAVESYFTIARFWHILVSLCYLKRSLTSFWEKCYAWQNSGKKGKMRTGFWMKKAQALTWESGLLEQFFCNNGLEHMSRCSKTQAWNSDLATMDEKIWSLPSFIEATCHLSHTKKLTILCVKSNPRRIFPL